MERDKIVLITGSTDGIGKAAAKVLSRMGYTTIIHGRNREKVENVIKEIKTETGNGNVYGFVADLLSFEEIKNMSEEIKKRFDRLDVLVNNAGGIFGKKRELSRDGFEKTLTLNLFSSLLLTLLLLDLLSKSKSARIIFTSSLMHRFAKSPDFDDFQFEKNYSPSQAYALSKLYVLWIAKHLATELQEKGYKNITVNALHPGVVATNFGKNVNKGIFWNFVLKVGRPFMATPEKGAMTTVYLASSDDVENVTGKFFGNMKEIKADDKYYSKKNEKIVWDYCLSVIEPYLDKKF